jgi:enoyl-CoA hydratase/carnithine racemase
VITGADPAFCSGDDVREIMGGGETRDKPVITAPRLTPAADAILHTNIPVIAAVNGAAVGWGMELSLMADIRIASEKAKFGELFVLRRLCTDVCGIGRLASVIGRDQAARLLFTGDVIPADEALRIGLVSQASPTTGCCRPPPRWPRRSPIARRSPSPRSSRACARPSTRTGPSSGRGFRRRSPRCSRPNITARA